MTSYNVCACDFAGIATRVQRKHEDYLRTSDLSLWIN